MNQYPVNVYVFLDLDLRAKIFDLWGSIINSKSLSSVYSFAKVFPTTEGDVWFIEKWLSG